MRPDHISSEQETPQAPSKETVRAWLQRRRLQPEPLPEIEQIRAELNWRPECGEKLSGYIDRANVIN